MSSAEPVCVMVAGMSVMTPAYARAAGSAVTTSLLKTVCRLTLCVSMIGLAPVTVTDSSIAPTFSSAFTVAVNEPVSSIPSRLNVLNPASVNVTT
jgi:hypothetical protein